MATILVVDDEPDLVDIVRLRLEREGHNVLTAFDGPTGLALTQTHQPDLVILDLMMPGMDGFEVLREIKSDPRLTKTPVIMLTARGDYSAKAQAWEEYAHTYLTKPFDPGALSEAVKNALEPSSQG